VKQKKPGHGAAGVQATGSATGVMEQDLRVFVFCSLDRVCAHNKPTPPYLARKFSTAS